jgi:hypothetical protein
MCTKILCKKHYTIKSIFLRNYTIKSCFVNNYVYEYLCVTTNNHTNQLTVLWYGFWAINSGRKEWEKERYIEGMMTFKENPMLRF